MIDVLGNTMKYLEDVFSPSRDVVPEYYDLEYHGMMKWEETSLADIKEKAQEWFAAQCQDSMKNGETRESLAIIVGYDDGGEEVYREPLRLFYERYHNDLKEHGNGGTI